MALGAPFWKHWMIEGKDRASRFGIREMPSGAEESRILKGKYPGLDRIEVIAKEDKLVSLSIAQARQP